VKAISLLLSFCLILQALFSSAVAGTFTIVRLPSGYLSSYRGQAAAPKIGPLLGPNLFMVVNENSVQVQRHDEATNTRTTLLSGVLFNAQIHDLEHEPRFNSYCFFNSGEKLAELLGEDANNTDLVLTTDDRQFTGRITEVDRNTITIADKGVEKQIATNQIQTVASSRVFHLTGLVFRTAPAEIDNRSGFQARILRFELDRTLDEFMTASGKRLLEKTYTSSKGYTKKQKRLMIGAAVLVTAIAIATPLAIAIPLAGKRRVEPPPVTKQDNDAAR